MTTKTTAPTTAPIDCRGCGRTITSARSLREASRNGGYGRGCARKVVENAKAAAQTESPAQVAKAVDLIQDGGLVHVRRGVYQTVSSDGLRTHLTSAQACTCSARKRCYHNVAVAILTSRPVKPARVFALPGAPVVTGWKLGELAADPFANIPGAYAA